LLYFTIKVGIRPTFLLLKEMMKKEQILTRIRQIVLSILEAENVELVDFELRGPISNQIIRVYVDVESGVDLNLCVDLSRKIADRLDIENIITGQYRLEVSSPGVHRPLISLKDFRRNIGRRVDLTYKDGISLKGVIERVDEANIHIDKDGELVCVPLIAVKSGKLILQW